VLCIKNKDEKKKLRKNWSLILNLNRLNLLPQNATSAPEVSQSDIVCDLK